MNISIVWQSLAATRCKVGAANVCLVAVSLLLFAFPEPLSAEISTRERLIEEVLVTAERRERSVLETPITITAFNAQIIEELGMRNPQDLEQLVPGLQFGSAALQQRSDGQGITIRGIGTQNSREEHRDLGVATYIDGVYTADTYGLAPNFFDMERIEVTRGPQGTLHGRNSIAGAVFLYGKKPTDEWDSEVLVEVTDQASQRYNAAIGGPLFGNFSFRLTGGIHQGDGFQRNRGPGNDLGEPDQTTITPQVRFKSDRFDLTAKYQRVEDKGPESELVRFTDFDRGNFQFNPNWYLYDAQIPSIRDCDDVVVLGRFPSNAFTPTPETANARVHCDDLRNEILSNRDAFQDSQTDRYTINAEWNISDQFALRYVFGHGETGTLTTQDGDQTARIGSPTDPTIPADLSATDSIACGFPFLPDDDRRSSLECWTLGQSFGLAFEDTEENFAFSNKEISHEVSLMSDLGGPLEFVVGVYTYDNETFWEQAGLNFSNPLRFVDADEAAVAASPIFGVFPVTSCQSYLDDFFIPVFGDPDTGTAFGLGLGCPEGRDHTKESSFFSGTENKTRAAFGSVDYRVNERWQVSSGLRWTEDRKRQLSRVPADLEPAAGTVPEGTVPSGLFVGDFFGTGVPVAFTLNAERPARDKWSKVIGHISVEYKPNPGRMYYSRISTGYRAGGFNFFNLDLGNSFDEETLVNYEVGMKGLFFDNRMQLTSGFFYQTYEGYQITATQLVDPALLEPTASSPLRSYTTNVDSTTKIWGIELEGIVQINDNWRVIGFYNYLDSELGDHSTVVRNDPEQQFTSHTFVCQIPPDFQCTTQVPLPRNHKGDQLPQMPKHKAALNLAYTRSLERSGSLRLLTTYSYTGSRWPQGGGNVSRTEVPSFDRWDIRGTWTSPAEVWDLTLYVQNVLDEVGISESIVIDGRGTLTMPRQFGLQLRWRPNWAR